jgi:RimJ/RimL family protein N-acetyltransferase
MLGLQQLPIEVIQTDRLSIRFMSTGDSEFMLGLMNEPTWLQFIGDRGVRTIEDAHDYILSGPIDMYSRLGFGFYVVEIKKTGRAIGICGLAKRDFLDSVDLGFALLPKYCGQGYAYESARGVLEYAKKELGLNRIVATVRSDNRASAKLLGKLGLRFEKTIRHPDGDRELDLFATALE